MGAFDTLFSKIKARRELRSYFKMLDGYAPVFNTFDGGVYEMELTRSCIHAFANHASKLQPNVEGSDARKLRDLLNRRPNPFMTGAQFLYKAATIYEAQNTVFIMPIIDAHDKTVGYYPANPTMIEIVDYNGQPFVRVTFQSGEKAAVELNRVGIVSKYLYRNDIMGENNGALNPTLQLLHMQNQGIAEGIKNSASFRFMANINNFSKAEDLAEARRDFVEKNLGPDAGGLALFPHNYTNVKQIISSPRVVDPEQMRIIQERVFNYFGTNTEILQNKAVGDTWSAFYEGKIEPFAIQLSQAMTCMTYTPLELGHGNAIVWSANRLQYMTNTDKLQVSSQMFDRGVLSLNDIMDIWNLPHVENGEKRYIRKEYTEVDKLDQEAAIPAEPARPEPKPSEEENE